MTRQRDIKLILFENEPSSVTRALHAEITDFMTDWEYRGKEIRQSGHDTEINKGTLSELAAVSAMPGATSWCRLNGLGPWTRREVAAALAAGVSVLLLPMVTSADEAETFLEYVDGRCRAGVIIETREACRCAAEIAEYPLDAVYVGLNDLMISLGKRSIFSALASGLVEEVRACFDVPLFGLGGLTVLDKGRPLPCRFFIQEMSRLGCTMTFLRRSYKHDIAGRDIPSEVQRVQAYWQELSRRTGEEVARDHRRFLAAAGEIEASHTRVTI